MDIPPQPPQPSPEDVPPHQNASPEGTPQADTAPPAGAAPSSPEDASPSRDAWPSPAIPTQADGPSYAAAPAPFAASQTPFDAAQTVGADTPPPAAGGPAGPPVPPAPQGAVPPYGQGPYGTPPPYGPQPYGPQAPYPGAGPYPAGGPYGPPAGPYGYPGPAWYPVEQSTNGLAITALVVSLAAGCVPFLGLIFGIIGLRQIRRTGQRGRGLAISGIVISSVMTVLVGLFISLAVIGALNEGNTQVEDLKAGQCFNTVGHSLSDYGDEGTRSTSVDVVSCDGKHDAEAYAVFPLDPSLGDDYPGVDAISGVADDKCAAYADDYLGDESLDDGMDIYYYLPPREGWDHGDRSVTCFFGSRGGKVSGSVKSAGDTSGVGV